MSTQGSQHWKNRAIEKSGLLSDFWDVFISYGGRAAGWILFACMVTNIIQVIPGVHLFQIVVSVVMGVQIITLDIAGFGLNTIAKHVIKHTRDEEAENTAKSAKKLAGLLIALMIITVALITIGALYPPAKHWTDIIDNILILARIILIVIYMHTMHDLRQVELEVQAIETQTAQANDRLALENKQRIDSLVNTVSDLGKQVSTFVDRVNARVDLEQFNALSQTVFDMRSSVNQVNQNILNITQNLYNAPTVDRVNGGYTTHIDEVNDALTPLPERAGSHAQERDTDSLNALPVPILDVPGVPQEKVQAVLTAHLNGSPWRNIPGKYATTKLIKEAYEFYQITQGQQVRA